MDHTEEPSTPTENVPSDSDPLIVADDAHTSSVAGDTPTSGVAGDAHTSSSSYHSVDEETSSSDDSDTEDSFLSADSASSTSNSPEYELRYYCPYCPKKRNYTSEERYRHNLKCHMNKSIGTCTYCGVIHFRVEELPSHADVCPWRALMIRDTVRYWNKINSSMKPKRKRDEEAYRTLKDKARNFCYGGGTSRPQAPKRSWPKSSGDESWKRKRSRHSERASPDDENYFGSAESNDEDPFGSRVKAVTDSEDSDDGSDPENAASYN